MTVKVKLNKEASISIKREKEVWHWSTGISQCSDAFSDAFF